MRSMGLFLVGMAAILMSVAWVDGQQEEKKKGGFGGFGGIGGLQQQLDPLNLLRNASVKKELNVTDEQIEKLSPEILNAIAKVLNETQMKRFRQIELQERKNEAFRDPAVQSTLKMSDEQKKNITTILDDAKKETSELFKAGAGARGGFAANREKMETISKETKEKIYQVLSSQQRKDWRTMIGEEFKVERPTFNFGGGAGGFGKGGFGGKGKKKTDE